MTFYLWNGETILTEFGTDGNDGVQNKEGRPKQDEQHEDDPEDFGGLRTEEDRGKGREGGYKERRGRNRKRGRK